MSLTGWAEVAPEAMAWSVPWGTAKDMLGLPDALPAEIAGDYPPEQPPDTVEVPVRWHATPAYDPETAGVYTFTARAADADLDPEEHGEPYWANLIAGLPAPQRVCTVLPREQAGESGDNAQWILSIDALPADQQALFAVPGTPLEDLNLPPILMTRLSAEAAVVGSDPSQGTPAEIPVTWESVPAYDAQAWLDAEAVRDEAMLREDWAAVDAIEWPPEEYLFTPVFDAPFLLAKGAVLPEISLTLARPMMLMAKGAMGTKSLGDTWQQDGLLFSVLSEDPGVSGTVDVKAATTLSGAVVIPSTVTFNNTLYTVTTIQSLGFEGQTGITSVSLPEGLINIGASAFFDCTYLASVSAPPATAVEMIYAYAFSGCDSLQTFDVPAKSFANHVFNDCTSLQRIALPLATRLGNNAFEGCTGLREVTFPATANTLQFIDATAFSDCSALTTIHNCPHPNIVRAALLPTTLQIVCDPEFAWLYWRSNYTNVKSKAFTPFLTDLGGAKIAGQSFQLDVDLGCGFGDASLDAGIFTVSNGVASNFRYTPHVNGDNITTPTSNVTGTVDITPTMGGEVTVSIIPGKYSFFGTGNNAAVPLSVTASGPTIDGIWGIPASLPYTGDDLSIHVTGTAFMPSTTLEVRVDGGGGVQLSGAIATFRSGMLTIPPNASASPVKHTLSLWLNGTHIPAFDTQVTVAGKPSVQGMTVAPDNLNAAGGAVQVNISGANLSGHQLEVRVDGAAPGTAFTATQDAAAGVVCPLPANTGSADRQHVLSLWLNGADSGLRQTVTVKGVPVTPVEVAEVTGVSVSRANLPYLGGDVTLTVTGNNLRLAVGSGITFSVNGAGSNRVRIQSDTRAEVALTISRNGTIQQKRFVLDIYLNGQDTGYSTSITVASPLDILPGMGSAAVPGSFSSFSSFSGGGFSSVGLGSFADMATVLGIDEDTPEYLLVYVVDEDETVVYILDTTTVEMDTEGLLSLDAQQALLMKNSFFGCTVSLRMLEEYASELAAFDPDTEHGYLAVTLPGGSLLHIPFHMLWQPDPEWTPVAGAEDEEAPLAMLPELQTYLTEFGIPLEDLRLRLTLTPLPEDGGYAADLSIIPEESWAALGVEPLAFATLYYPVTLTPEAGGEPLEIYQSGEYPTIPAFPDGEGAAE